MANNYLQFAESMNLQTEEQVTWWREAVSDPGDQTTPKWSKELYCWIKDEVGLGEDEPYGAEITFDPHPDDPAVTKVFFVAEGMGNPMEVGLLVKAFLKHFKMDKEIFRLTWSETCSKMRVGEFGGGYLITNSQDLVSMSLDEMVELEVGSMEEMMEGLKADGTESETKA